MSRTPLLERAMRAVLDSVPPLSLDQSLVAYRQLEEYRDLPLEDRAFLIVELDRMRHADLDAMLDAHRHDQSIVAAMRYP